MITIIGKSEDVQMRVADFQKACPDLRVVEIKNHFTIFNNWTTGMSEPKLNGRCTIKLEHVTNSDI